MEWKRFATDWESISVETRKGYDTHTARMAALLIGPIYITDRDPEPGDLVEIIANNVVNEGKDDFYPKAVGDSYIRCFATVLANTLLYKDGDEYKRGCLLDISPLVSPDSSDTGIGFTFDELRIIDVEASMAFLQGEPTQVKGASYAVAEPPKEEKISCGKYFHKAVRDDIYYIKCTPERQCADCEARQAFGDRW